MLVILIPSHFEAKDLLARLEGREAFRASEADGAAGRLAGEAALVGVIGMGPPHAARRAQAVLAEARQWAADDDLPAVRGVLLCGFAGALKPSLKRGDIFLTAGAEHLVPHLPETERPATATLHTAEKIVPDAAAKAELHTRTGAWLVDMEQAQVAAVAAAAGLPFLGVRIVSDEAHEDLPHDILAQAYDQEKGSQTPWKLAGHLTRNPFKLAPLASFLRPLPSLRTRMSDHLHRWLTLTGPRLFR